MHFYPVNSQTNPKEVSVISLLNRGRNQGSRHQELFLKKTQLGREVRRKGDQAFGMAW